MEVTEEKLRLDALHNEELLRIAKTQEQERAHIAQKQAQERHHVQLMLDIKHRAKHDSTLSLQRAHNQEDFEHRERILRLEHQYASSEKATKPGDTVPRPEDKPLRSEGTIKTTDEISEPEDGEFGNRRSWSQVGKARESRLEILHGFARAAAKRDEEKRRQG